MGKKVKLTDDGLPVLEREQTEDGLPIIKKKVEGPQPPTISQNGSGAQTSWDEPVNKPEVIGNAIHAQSSTLGTLYDLGRKAISVFKDEIPGAYAGEKAIQKKTDFIEELQRKEPHKYQLQNEYASDETKRKFAEEEARKEFGDQFESEKQKYEAGALSEKQANLAEFSKQRKEGAEFTKGIPGTFEEAKKEGKITSYIGGALGNGIGQILPAALTGGTSSYFMEKTDAYDEALHAIAKENGISTEEVVKKNLDQPAKEIAHVVGLVNGGIDLGSSIFTIGKGAGQTIKQIIKSKAQEQILKNIPEKVVKESLLKQGAKTAAAPLVEYGTEFWQGTNTQIGALIASGKDFKDINWKDKSEGGDIDWNQSHEEGLQGMIGSTGIVAAGKTYGALKNGKSDTGTGEGGETATQAASEPVQRNAEQQAEPTSEAGVQQDTGEAGQTNAEESAAVLDKNSTLDKQDGREQATTESISPGAQQENRSGQLEQAQNVVRAIQESSPNTQRSPGQIRKDEDAALEQFAQENNLLIDESTLEEPHASGQESDVYADVENNTVTKVNSLRNHNTWAEFFDRLQLQNEVFPDENYQLKGFVKKNDKLHAVVDQPLIEGTPVTKEERNNELAKMGFYPIGKGPIAENIFYNEDLGVRISDVHDENVIKDTEGNIRFIDPVIDRENPFVDEESKQDFNAAKKQETQISNEPDYKVGNYQKRDGSWYLTNKDGELEKVVDLNKPASETKGSEVKDELEQLKKLQEELSNQEVDDKITQKERDRIKNLDRPTLMSRVRGYFLDGGKIRWNEERDALGKKKKRGTREEMGFKEGERKNLIGIQDKNGLSPEEIGENLASSYTDESYNDRDYKEAVLELLGTDRANWFADQREEVDEEYGIQRNNNLYEAEQISERIKEIESQDLETQERLANENAKELYQNERRVYPTPEGQGSSVAGQDSKQADQTKRANAAARISELGDPDESRSAVERINSSRLSIIPNPGTTAKGASVKVLDKQTDGVVKADVSNPFVANADDFISIQAEVIKERFGKDYVEDLNEAEADLLAEMMTEYFAQEGYDSIYMPEIGELFVFDKSKVGFNVRSGVPRESQRQSSEPTGKGPGLPNPPEAKPPGKGTNTETGDGKQRTIAKRYLNDPDVSDEVKAGLSEDGKNYIPTTDLKRQAEADAYIEEKGIDQAILDITDPDNGMSDDNRVFIGKTLYKRLKEEVKTSDNPDAVRDKINRVVEDVAKMGTKAGQTVQAFAHMFTSDAEQVAHALKKEYNKERKKVVEASETQIKSLQNLITEATDEALRDLINDPRIKQLIEESRAASNTRQGKRKQFTQKILSRLDQIEQEIDANLKSGRFNSDLTFGLLPLAYKAAINTIRIAVKAGDSLIDALEKAVAEINKNQKTWDEEGFRKMFEDDIKQEEKTDRKTLREALEENGDDFRTLAKAHYKTYASKKQDLAKVLEEKFKLETNEAERLVKALDKIVGEKRQKIIEQKFAPKVATPKTKRVAKQVADKIKEFTDLGIMSDKNLRDAYLDAIGLPKISDEQAREMEKMVEKAESKPEGFQRYEAIQDMIRYHQSITPVTWGSVIEAVWYANMLSGLSTHKVNFEANTVRTLSETFVSGIQSILEYKKPVAAIRNMGFMLRGLVEGYQRNLKESANVLKYGYTPIKSKYESNTFTGIKTSQASVLEILDKKNPLNLWKYVGRLMVATDIIFYGGLKHMRAHQLAFRQAYNENLNVINKGMIARANEILGRTNHQLDVAKRQAETEGLTGRDYKRRVFEIMEQSWAETNMEDAVNFASKGTYNHDPEGVMGLLTSVINTTTAKVPLLKTVVPFSRVISNVVNDYLDYTPWGLVRSDVKKGMGIPNKSSFTKFTEEERLRTRIKAIAGTTAMIALYAMSQSEDDEEPLLEITSDGTGNFKKNFELAEGGWKEYTAKIKGTDVRFDYRNTQLAIPFAVIGYINDANKYKNKKVDDNQLGLIFSGTFHFISDLSFLSGLSDFFEILTDEKEIGQKLLKFGERTAKTAILPNVFTQVSRSIQEILEVPMKKGTSFYGQMARDLPVLRDNLGTMYNTLGDPIVTETLYKFNPLKMSSEADNKEDPSYKLWNLIAESQAWIGTPSKSVKIYDPKLELERQLTDEEYDEFALKSARYTKELLLNNYEGLKAETDMAVVRDWIYELKEQARQQAKYDLFQSMP